jgi:hypothetical protein
MFTNVKAHKFVLLSFTGQLQDVESPISTVKSITIRSRHHHNSLAKSACFTAPFGFSTLLSALSHRTLTL